MRLLYLDIVLLGLFLNLSQCMTRNRKPRASTSKRCSLAKDLVSEIASYQDVANRIINEVLKGSFRGRTYNDLAFFVDKFGSRLTGTLNLENSIEFMLKKMSEVGLTNVHGELAMVPHWVRGEESAQLISPVQRNFKILGLGFSIGTPHFGIEAQCIVVKSFDELKSRSQEVKGKIVVFNQDFDTYDTTLVYRKTAASETAKLGGVAALVRSVTPFSIYSPHTGDMAYETNVKKIPAACITVEDAELLQRMEDRRQQIVILLKMQAKNYPDVVSRNAIGEITGSKSPNDIVIVSGHIDSWDVGLGAMDDGGAVFITVEAMALLRFMNLTPRRTLRAILWTSEEFGYQGIGAYVKQHIKEIASIKAALESDQGTFKPLGLNFVGTKEAGCIIKQILKLFKPINATKYYKVEKFGFDIDDFTELGIPGISLHSYDTKYFYFQHTDGDTMTVENTDELDLCTAFWAAVSYIIADLSVDLPQK